MNRIETEALGNQVSPETGGGRAREESIYEELRLTSTGVELSDYYLISSE